MTAVARVQCRTVQVLSELVLRASRAGLPVVAWSVSSGNLLSATCLGQTDAQVRAAFEAWVGFVGARRRLEQHDPAGVLMLRALRDNVNGCRVLITADLHGGLVEGGDRR